MVANLDLFLAYQSENTKSLIVIENSRLQKYVIGPLGVCRPNPKKAGGAGQGTDIV